MIVERAQVEVQPGRQAEFEAALERGRHVLVQAHGLRSVTFGRCVEDPARYLLLIEWETLEDHTEGFRGSDLFAQWRELIGPFFAAAPEVEHYEPLGPQA